MNPRVSFLCCCVSIAAAAAPPVESQAREFAAQYQRPAKGLAPDAPERVALGRQLFFDPRLSASGIVSCATCHNPALSWGDGLPRAVGHSMKTLGRRSPTVLNAGWGGPFMWDGRFETLEEQAMGPITSPAEMNMAAGDVLARLSAVEGYRQAFEKNFPGEGVTAKGLASAIAAFERTIVSPPAPFDRWVQGDAAALSDAAKRGFVVFNTKAACAKCHSGWRFTDDSFHDIGVKDADRGRGALKDFEGIEALDHAFKTPTLRDADRRAPFLHDGSEATLEAIVDFYDVGGRARRPSVSSDVQKLSLTAQEKKDLVAFLKTLSSPADAVVPALPR